MIATLRSFQACDAILYRMKLQGSSEDLSFRAEIRDILSEDQNQIALLQLAYTGMMNNKSACRRASETEVRDDFED